MTTQSTILDVVNEFFHSHSLRHLANDSQSKFVGLVYWLSTRLTTRINELYPDRKIIGTVPYPIHWLECACDWHDKMKTPLSSFWGSFEWIATNFHEQEYKTFSGKYKGLKPWTRDDSILLQPAGELLMKQVRELIIFMDELMNNYKNLVLDR